MWSKDGRAGHAPLGVVGQVPHQPQPGQASPLGEHANCFSRLGKRQIVDDAESAFAPPPKRAIANPKTTLMMPNKRLVAVGRGANDAGRRVVAAAFS